jgi:hypothetical protein
MVSKESTEKHGGLGLSIRLRALFFSYEFSSEGMDLGLDIDLIDSESAGDVMDGTDTLCKLETTGEVKAYTAGIDSVGEETKKQN